nr:MAG TPA: hypothetical protein [Caudoviricetes sp.]
MAHRPACRRYLFRRRRYGLSCVKPIFPTN